MELQIESANFPPIADIKTISKRYPNCRFICNYSSEPEGIEGIFAFSAGELTMTQEQPINNPQYWLASFEDKYVQEEKNQTYLVHHYADEKARNETAQTIFVWAIDEGYRGNNIEKAIALLNDIGNLLISLNN